MSFEESAIKNFLGWLAGGPKGEPLDQQMAWDAAVALVEDWKEGWKDPDAEQPDRAKLLNDILQSEAGPHLLMVMRRIGPIKAFTMVGADDELAANIVSVGTAKAILQTK